MKLRSTFLDNGKRWRIFVASQKELLRLWGPRAKPDGTCAFIDTDTASIFVLSGCTPRQEREYILHELLHKISDERKLRMGHGRIYPLAKALSRLVRMPWEAT